MSVMTLALLSGCQRVPESVAEKGSVERVDIEGSGTTVLREGFAGPESALHDAEQDVYFISNVNGAATDADGNGYISRVKPADGEIVTKWIDGAGTNVTLNAPKGMAIAGEDLWVADITVLRRFNRRNGQQVGEIAIPGSIFLNDVAAGPDGSLYVSDSGMEGSTEKPAANAMDAIYRVTSNGEVQKIASGQHLRRPNGLAFEAGNLWAVTFGSNQLFRVTDGQIADVRTLPKGSLDGLVRLEDSTFLVSSWDANGIYRGPASGPFELIVQNVNSPADIGFDAKRSRLLAPHLMENQVSIHPIDP